MRPSPFWLLPVVTLAFLTPFAGARDDDEPRYATQSALGTCACAQGQGSWEYLGAPFKVPDDPPRCGLLLSGGDCGSHPRPRGTSGVCWGHPKKECFFKRHAYSFKLRCSECWRDETCDACDELIDGRKPEVLELLEKQLALEGSHDKHRYVLAISPHFYVLSDIDDRVKVKTKGGARRVISSHEFVHLFAERCERAYADFAKYFGANGNVSLQKPMGVYLTDKQRHSEDFAQRYLGSANTDMLYGGGSTKIAGGFCGNGFVGSFQEQRSDEDLHAYCRHMIGHILFSCWIVVDGNEKVCPKWAFIGSAHFMEKLLKPHEDYATFCSNETTAPTGSGKDWMKKSRGLATRRLDPIETFFGRESLGRFDYDDHIRAWSLMDLGLTEDNERFTKALAHMRRGNDEGFAFKEAIGVNSSDFHDRWVDRLTGRRPTMGEVRRDADDPDGPGQRERERVKSTEDPDTLAGLIRGVDTVEDVKMAKAIVDRLDHESDLVRETIQWVLGRTTNEDVRAWLRTEGLGHRDKMSRAGVARALGRIGDESAREPLEALLEDGFWLARANAAWALSLLHQDASVPVLNRALAGERQPKAWMAIADARAMYATREEEPTLATRDYLSHGSWQLRVTAARALAQFGTGACMDALIDRYATERGRLELELLRALKAVSGDDLGTNPATWEKWWNQQKEQHGGLDPNVPPPPNPDDDRYYDPKKDQPSDDPHYYGRRIFSRSVGFVFDVSSSMDKNITIAEGTATKLGDIPQSGTRMTVAREVLAGAIRQLKPAVHFSLVFFSTDVRPWKGGKMVQASAGNVDSAASAVMNQPADGETNIHGALKAALGLHEKSTLEANLDDIPDTVYFLTDGSPTRGEITATPELLGWFENLNRFAKVRLYVVAFGNLGVDLKFLGGLAKAGGGELIHVPEK